MFGWEGGKRMGSGLGQTSQPGGLPIGTVQVIITEIVSTLSGESGQLIDPVLHRSCNLSVKETTT